MSDIPVDTRTRLDLDELVARIERQQEETRKFVAEQHKLMAEAKKFGRDPWFLLIGALAAAVTTRLPEILHALGLGR
jgi:cytoskeletal protein RodZ